GLLQHYDTLVVTQANIASILQRLQTNIPSYISPKGQQVLTETITNQQQLLVDKAILIERFHTNNAVLRNSTNYFPTVVYEEIIRAQQANINPYTRTHLERLLIDILDYEVRGNDDQIPSIEDHLDWLEEHQLEFPVSNRAVGTDIEVILRHAEIIIERKPIVRNLVSQIFILDNQLNENSLFDIYNQHYEASQQTANQYEVLLFLFGLVILTYISVTIIVRLRRSATALDSARKQYRSIFENATEGIFRTEPGINGKLISINPAMARIIGCKHLFTDTQILKRSLYVDPSRYKQFLEAIEQEGHVMAFESQIVCPDGQLIWISENVRAVREDGDGDVLYYDGVMRNITQRKKLESERETIFNNLELLVETRTMALRASQQEAERANRAKSTFLANMSHELRTPLNAILGFAQLLEQEPEIPAKQQEKLTTINRSGQYLLELINDILEMSKIEAGELHLNLRKLPLKQTVTNLVDLMSLKAQDKGLTLTVHWGESVPQFIRADQGKLRQVLLNLLSNAIKFTETGKIDLYIRSVIKDDVQAAPRLRFRVKDTGVGIAPTELSQLFDAFVQTSSGRASQEGTGLGLAISQQFVQVMGGNLMVESEQGIGSTFYFEIDYEIVCENPMREPIFQKRVKRLAPNQPDYRCLIVEDTKENRDFLRQLLESVGFQVKTAVNGEEGIKRFQDWHPHIILMDIRMPVLDGYEATKRIRRLNGNKNVVIVALTASIFQDEKEAILAAGCDDFLGKPFTASNIFQVIQANLPVTYIYENENLAPSTPETQAQTLLIESIVNLSPEWQKRLHFVASTLDADKSLQIIQEIEDEHTELANALKLLVKNFRFDKIMKLTHSLENAV
ncbi:MAG: DAHL domain-containing protein, partial [Chloroflexota bacterium]